MSTDASSFEIVLREKADRRFSKGKVNQILRDVTKKYVQTFGELKLPLKLQTQIKNGEFIESSNFVVLTISTPLWKHVNDNIDVQANINERFGDQHLAL